MLLWWRWPIILFVCLWFFGVIALFTSGGIIYDINYNDQATHIPNLCEVISKSYDEEMCRGGRFSSDYVCYRPWWQVRYSVDGNATEYASIGFRRFRTIVEAENTLSQYKIGMTYSCWTNIIYPFKAKWEVFSPFSGMMLLIFGGIAAFIWIAFMVYVCCLLEAEKRQRIFDQLSIDCRKN